jgi:hypothetical protein
VPLPRRIPQFDVSSHAIAGYKPCRATWRSFKRAMSDRRARRSDLASTPTNARGAKHRLPPKPRKNRVSILQHAGRLAVEHSIWRRGAASRGQRLAVDCRRVGCRSVCRERSAGGGGTYRLVSNKNESCRPPHHSLGARVTLSDCTRWRFFVVNESHGVRPDDTNLDHVTFETVPPLGGLSGSKETDIEIQRLRRQATSVARSLTSLAGWTARRAYRAPPPFRFRPRPGARFRRHCDPL